jgi:general stress protein YciG
MQLLRSKRKSRSKSRRKASRIHLRGFASMKDKERQRQIAVRGGRAAHRKGTAHEWTSGKKGTAAKAGRKGGKASHGGRGKNYKKKKKRRLRARMRRRKPSLGRSRAAA